MLGLGLGCYFFVSIVAEGDGAVRLRSGVLGEEKVEAGLHWDIPYFYALRINRGAFQIRIRTLSVPALPGSKNAPQPVITLWFIGDGRQYFKAMQANNAVDNRAASDAQIDAELQQRLILALAKRSVEKSLPLRAQDWQQLTQQVAPTMFADYGVRLVSFKPKD